jgi:hypothetical protein
MSDGHWQLEGAATAELFERYLVPAITAKWAEDLNLGREKRFSTSLAGPALWRVSRRNEWAEGR